MLNKLQDHISMVDW